MRISDWSSDVCSSDLTGRVLRGLDGAPAGPGAGGGAGRLRHPGRGRCHQLARAKVAAPGPARAAITRLPWVGATPPMHARVGVGGVAPTCEASLLAAAGQPRGQHRRTDPRQGEERKHDQAERQPAENERGRKENRRVGKRWVSTCRYTWSEG